VHASLDEDLLVAPMTEIIELDEARLADAVPKTLVDTIARRVVESFETLGERLQHRVGPFTACQLEEGGRSMEDSLVIVSTAFEAVLDAALGDEKHSKKLVRLALQKRDRPSDNGADKVLESLACKFFAQTNETKEREIFAMLAQGFEFERSKQLKTLMRLAADNAKTNIPLLERLKILKRRKKATPSALA
jgi:hypothetical protein